jgi:hypothetical protein
LNFFRKGGELTLAEVTCKVGPACLCLLLLDCPSNLIYLMYLLYEIEKSFNLFLRVLIWSIDQKIIKLASLVDTWHLPSPLRSEMREFLIWQRNNSQLKPDFSKCGAGRGNEILMWAAMLSAACACGRAKAVCGIKTASRVCNPTFLSHIFHIAMWDLPLSLIPLLDSTLYWK